VDQGFSFFFFKKQPEIVVTNFDFFAKTLISYFKFLVIPRDDMIWTKILRIVKESTYCYKVWEIKMPSFLELRLRLNRKGFLKMVLTLGSVDETLVCDHSNESYWAVLSCGTVYFAVQGGSNFKVCGWNPNVWPFKWKILSSAFMWYCLLCCTRWF